MYRLLCISLLITLAYCAREADRVTYLPGLEEQPEFNHYAGYLNAGDGKQFFYWFVESENDPANDPMVVWYNGGPGCSSLTGFLVELGPWRVNPDGSGLHWFEHRWNKVANMVFIESPAGVGYSYDENCDYETNDNETAFYNHMALRDFFSGFPEYSGNDFYITGESYAGVYVPTLAARIVDDSDFNFKGIAVGNGLTDYEIMQNGLMPFAWARGVFGSKLAARLVENCCVDGDASNCDYYLGSDEISPQCAAALWEANIYVWANGLNPYNIYGHCDGGVTPNSDNPDHVFIPEETPALGRVHYDDMMTKMQSKVQRLQNTNCSQVASEVVCTDASARDIYLNDPEVREALHVGEDIHQWTFCSATVSAGYKRQYRKMNDEYHKVLDAGHRVLIFYGDLDMACEHLGGMWFVEALGLGDPIKEYKPWYYVTEVDGTTQIAGYSIMYERLNYVTVKGAGHFVPTDMPVPSYEMWVRFLNNDPF